MVPSEVGYVPSGHIKEMLNSIHDLKKPNMPEIEVIQFDPLLDSSNMAVKEWNLIGRTIRDNYDCFDGFVVLHGTDTMSYSVERPVKNGVSFNQASVNNCNILLIKPFGAKAVDVNHSYFPPVWYLYHITTFIKQQSAPINHLLFFKQHVFYTNLIDNSFTAIRSQYKSKLKTNLIRQALFTSRRDFAPTAQILVETVGVEPTSKNVSGRFSPSAADSLIFTFPAVCQQTAVRLSRNVPELPGFHSGVSCIYEAGLPICR